MAAKKKAPRQAKIPPAAPETPAPSGDAPSRPEEAPGSPDDPWGAPSPAPSPKRATEAAPDAGTGPSGGGPAPGDTPSPPPAAPEAPRDAPQAPRTEVVIQRTGDRLKAIVSQPYRVEGIITPVTDVKKATAAWAEFNRLKEALLTKDDQYLVKGQRARLVPTRTGWRKLALFFGVSSDIVEEKRWERGGQFGYDFMVVATAPNGQHMVGVGSCDSVDLAKSTKGTLPATEHNVRAKAHTRAVNRAISDLIGGGELSAEEVEGETV